MIRTLLTLLVAVALAMPGLAADSGDGAVLVPGNPPLTRGVARQLTDLFAWALNGTFSPAQRDQFTQELINGWRNQPESTLQGYRGLVQAQEKLARMNPVEREQARQRLEDSLVQSFRQEPNSPLPKLLLAVHDQGARLQAAAPPAAQSPAALVGTWGTGSMSNITYQNRATGAFADQSGTQVQYTFHPDGRYEYAALTSQSMYSCNTKLFTYKTGKVQFEGSTLTFIPESGKFTSRDTCNAKYNYEKPAVLERENFRWRIEQDSAGVKMCLQNQSINGCAYKR